MKRYFTTNTLDNTFPIWFVSAPKRWVVVKFVQLVSDSGSKLGLEDMCIHADFIHEDNYLNSYIMPVNEFGFEGEKYEQFRYQNNFKVWFKDINGMELPTKQVYDSITERTLEVLDGFKFILKLLLIAEV